MTNGEMIETILDIDKNCTEVYGRNGMMTFFCFSRLVEYRI